MAGQSLAKNKVAPAGPFENQDLISKIRDDLNRFLFRSELSTEEVTRISDLVQYLDFNPGSMILREGVTNERLYFLVNGAVNVVSGGEKIATLLRPGDVLGEMSLITKQPCSASIIAETQVQLLVFEIKRAESLPPEQQGKILNSMNQLFSAVLAQKLYLTNEKARLFEITNRQLEKTQAALEAASKDRIDELSANQQNLVQKINTIFNEEIDAVRAQADQLDALNLPETSSISVELRQRVTRLANELDPLARNLLVDKSMANVRILLAENNIDDQINARLSLGGTGVSFEVVSNLVTAQEMLLQSKFNIVCVNSHFVDLLDFAKTHNIQPKFIFITSASISDHFQTLRDRPEITTILARHPDDRSFTVKNIATTVKKLASEDIFGLEKYLGWGTEMIQHTVSHSSERQQLVTDMNNYFTSMGARKILIKRCERVAEELLMNAVYDAPHDEKGIPIFNHLNRIMPVSLKPHQSAKFKYACDGNLIAISVEDPFGALTRSTVLNYLERCLMCKGSLPDIENKGGGGNGLFQVIQSSSLTVFNVRPKSRTEVISLININIQMHKISVHPSFHFFEIN